MFIIKRNDKRGFDNICKDIGTGEKIIVVMGMKVTKQKVKLIIKNVSDSMKTDMA